MSSGAARRRVLVTGIGLVTPLGSSAPATWRSLLAGESGIDTIRRFDAGGFPVHIGAEVKRFDESAVEPRLRKFAVRQHAFAIAAAAEALRDAGVAPQPQTAARWACVVGAGMMGVEFEELLDFQRRSAPDGALLTERMTGVGADPIAFARNQVNAGLGVLVQQFGIRGYANAVHTACASGGQAVGAAMRQIRRGAADWALAGGFDSMLNPVGLAGFCLLGALSTDNDTPQRASRPFDRTRNGFVLGEGAGFLVLESEEAARRRGARVYAELAGDGNALSSYRITDSHPSGSGAIQAMQQALDDAAVSPDEVDYINAHGTSTPMNDRSECAAVHAVFECAAQRLAVSSTKSLMGHLIAAAGAVEAAICALTVHEGVMPANANFTQRDPECDLPFVTGAPLRGQVRVALSNSFGFGGSNNCLVVRAVRG